MQKGKLTSISQGLHVMPALEAIDRGCEPPHVAQQNRTHHLAAAWPITYRNSPHSAMGGWYHSDQDLPCILCEEWRLVSAPASACDRASLVTHGHGHTGTHTGNTPPPPL
eukprot:3467611-Rhodomonas_salina.4